MYGFDFSKLKTKEEKTEQEELTFEDIVETYKLFYLLRNFVDVILNAESLEIETLDEALKFIVDGLDEEEQNKILTLFEKFLIYLKLPQDVIDDLMSDDEDIAKAEFENLAELLIDRIGENTIDEFIAYAIHNPDLPDNEFDDITFDWAFFPTKKECIEGREGLRKVPINKKTQMCVKGVSRGRVGYWRYPKGDFPNGEYQLKNGGTRNPENKMKHPNAFAKFEAKKHTPQADKKRMKDQQKRAELGLSTFPSKLAEKLKEKQKKKKAKANKESKSKQAREAL